LKIAALFIGLLTKMPLPEGNGLKNPLLEWLPVSMILHHLLLAWQEFTRVVGSCSENSPNPLCEF